MINLVKWCAVGAPYNEKWKRRTACRYNFFLKQLSLALNNDINPIALTLKMRYHTIGWWFYHRRERI